jgi:enoyl-CoA hydratase
MHFVGYKTLKFSYHDRVLTVTIDSGAPMNAVNHDLHAELARIFNDLQRDPDSDVVILTGEGRGFCAGGDMDWFREMIDDPRKFRDIGPDAKRIVFSMLELEKPLICRLNGPAAGLGASIALLCDVIIASDKAIIGDPHVKIGLVAGDGGAVIWPQLIGYARAKEFLMTGDMIPTPQAAQMGLINYAVPPEELDAKVAEVVGKIVGNPRWAVRWTKTAVNLTLKQIANHVMDPAIAYEVTTNSTMDHQEAVSAFVEKRAPNFTGE